MKSSQPEIPARYYARMAEVLQREGVDVKHVLDVAGIPYSLLDQSEGRLQLVQVERLVAAAIAITGRADLSLDMGRAVKLSSHSMVGYGMLSSPTVDYALRLAARFFRLIMPIFRMRYRSGSERAEISFEPTLPLSHDCLVFHLEAIASATHWELRELLQGRMPAYALYLSFAEPLYAARYAEMAEAHCHFGWETHPGLRMVFPADIAGRALALADPAALRMAEARCSTLVRTVVASGKVADWVRMMLREASDGMPTLTELAHTLNLSARTLDRYLQKEGMGYRELMKQGRHEKACTLLADGELSVTQIAYELGYTDASNFNRAFRRESALSPIAYRQNARRA